ncbi:hypothetical protein IVG45_10630 [Methylomonas sp. LL1]|uniref:hypothetical protein n=1 Tax=Methylomonas sp. LL1 TaxID=2785785 RepID=UPI0018C3DECE|nr:hypothetical protein [Methylomonas sp. LL1]QPK65346.1 hypothetical protein IVG45_10630 [Methylomonas sp. LL1]
MQELTDQQLYSALQYAKSQDENAGRAMLEQFQNNQPALAHTILGIFPSMIAEKDQNMAYLFMDLCFDVLCVFQNAFGALPTQQSMGVDWIEKFAGLLGAELQSFMTDQPMDSKIRNQLQDRFAGRMIDSNAQTGLVNFMNLSIDQYVAEYRPSIEAVRISKTMIFVVIQLFEAIYNQSGPIKH